MAAVGLIALSTGTPTETSSLGYSASSNGATDVVGGASSSPVKISLIAATSQSAASGPTIATSTIRSPSNLTGRWLSGESDAKTVADGTFADWRGRRIDIGGTWASYDSPEHQISSPNWAIAPGSPFADTPRMDYAVGGPLDHETWAQAASGSFDARWIAQLQTLRTAWGSRAASNMFIRFAHEMNGNWFSWSVAPENTDNFIAAWRRFYNLVQAYFPGAQLVWAPNDQTSWTYDPRSLWPGDQYVNVVGVDSYNQYPWVNSQASFIAKMNAVTYQGGPIGLESWRRFALSHAKRFAIPEWANASVANGGGGGDAPVFITLFHQWLVAHGGSGPGTVLYEILFNVGGYSVHYEMFAAGKPSILEPLTSEVYRQLW